MRICYSYVLVVIALLGLAKAKAVESQDASAGVSSAEAPLPPGALMRLSETRSRPGARISHLAFSRDGKQLASLGHSMYFEDRLSIWDANTGKELRARSVNEGQVFEMSRGDGVQTFA